MSNHSCVFGDKRNSWGVLVHRMLQSLDERFCGVDKYTFQVVRCQGLRESLKHATLSLTFSVFSEQAEFVAIDSIGRRKVQWYDRYILQVNSYQMAALVVKPGLVLRRRRGNFAFEFPQRKTTSKRRDLAALRAL